MTSSQFEYDVAISFLAKDQEIALKLYDSLSPRIRAFIYSKKQEEILGTDGMDTFSRVFSKRSRLNVVLFREGWGQTPWTRVEETMIKDRVFHDGWDTFCFVRLDKSAEPVWIPKTYLYVDFLDKRIEGTRAIIEQKILELGGKVRTETLEEYTERYKRNLENEAYIAKYPDTYEAVGDARKGSRELLSILEQKWSQIRDADVGISIDEDGKRVNEEFRVSAEGISLHVEWKQPIVNSLDKARLKVQIRRKEYTNFGVRDIQSLEKHSFKFSLNSALERGWFDDEGTFWRTSDLVEDLLKRFLKLIKDHKEF